MEQPRVILCVFKSALYAHDIEFYLFICSILILYYGFVHNVRTASCALCD